MLRRRYKPAKRAADTFEKRRLARGEGGTRDSATHVHHHSTVESGGGGGGCGGGSAGGSAGGGAATDRVSDREGERATRSSVGRSVDRRYLGSSVPMVNFWMAARS